MSYTKNEWKKGDKVTAKKLNNIENGIEELANNSGGGSSIVRFVKDIDNSTSSNDEFDLLYKIIKSNLVFYSGKINIGAGFDDGPLMQTFNIKSVGGNYHLNVYTITFTVIDTDNNEEHTLSIIKEYSDLKLQFNEKISQDFNASINAIFFEVVNAEDWEE